MGKLEQKRVETTVFFDEFDDENYCYEEIKMIEPEFEFVYNNPSSQDDLNCSLLKENLTAHY